MAKKPSWINCLFIYFIALYQPNGQTRKTTWKNFSNCPNLDYLLTSMPFGKNCSNNQVVKDQSVRCTTIEWKIFIGNKLSNLYNFFYFTFFFFSLNILYVLGLFFPTFSLFEMSTTLYICLEIFLRASCAWYTISINFYLHEIILRLRPHLTMSFISHLCLISVFLFLSFNVRCF